MYVCIYLPTLSTEFLLSCLLIPCKLNLMCYNHILFTMLHLCIIVYESMYVHMYV